MLYKTVSAFKSVDDNLKFNHSLKWKPLSRILGAVYYAVPAGSNLWDFSEWDP